MMVAYNIFTIKLGQNARLKISFLILCRAKTGSRMFYFDHRLTIFLKIGRRAFFGARSPNAGQQKPGYFDKTAESLQRFVLNTQRY